MTRSGVRQNCREQFWTASAGAGASRPGMASDNLVGRSYGHGSCASASNTVPHYVRLLYRFVEYQLARGKKLKTKTAIPAAAATGAMYCTTLVADVPPVSRIPASKGPTI